ncbi:hypothetical protein ACVXHA_27885 [Escherichia coli]
MGWSAENFRVDADGALATTGHPEALGSALTHEWILPICGSVAGIHYTVDGDIEHMLTFMRDLHRYTARNRAMGGWRSSAVLHRRRSRTSNWHSTALLTPDALNAVS